MEVKLQQRPRSFLRAELHHGVQFIDHPLPIKALPHSDISSIDGQCIMSIIARPAACPFNPADSIDHHMNFT